MLPVCFILESNTVKMKYAFSYRFTTEFRIFLECSWLEVKDFFIFR